MWNAYFRLSTSLVTKEKLLFILLCKRLIAGDPWFDTSSQICSVIRRAKYCGWINCKVNKIQVSCILAHGMEFKVPHWDVRTSRPYDLASKAIFLGLWPYCLEEKCGNPSEVWWRLWWRWSLQQAAVARLVTAWSEGTCLWEGKW
jgi:hypothetical protein